MPPFLSGAIRQLTVAVVCLLMSLASLIVLFPSGTGIRGRASTEPGTAERTEVVRFRPVGAITLDGPRSARVGARIALAGSVVVNGRQPRVVTLSELIDGRWRTVLRTRSDRKGAFSFRVRVGGRTLTRTFRARAAGAPGVPVVQSAPLRVAVGHQQVKAADDWSYLFGSDGSRWNPCVPIRWAYNPTGEPYRAARADVTRAFDEIAAVSGLTFQDEGATDYRQLNDSFGKFPEELDIVVSWADESEVPRLAGEVAGIGGARATSTAPGANVVWRLTAGYLTLDQNAASVAPGFKGGSWGQIMMHEALHALGLGHARWHDNQLMWPLATDRNYKFGRGDITGMKRIGLPAGCLA